MQHPTFSAQTASLPSAPSLHIPDVVRAVMLLGGLYVLASFTVLNEHVILGPLAWAAIAAYFVVALVAAARLVLVDAAAPSEASTRVERTRKIGAIKEVIIAGGGSLMLIVPVTYLAIATSQEVWAGRPEPSSFSPLGFAFTCLCGFGGFLMMFFRPQFVLDRAARKIVRHAFGRSIPLRVKEMPYTDLAVYSEGYFLTNTAQRLGDMIRGRVGKNTFEIEMLPGNLASEMVEARVMGWARELGAKYNTPDQAATALK